MLYLYIGTYLFHSLYFASSFLSWTLQSFHFMFFFIWRNSPQWASSFTSFIDYHNDAPKSVGLLWTSDQLVAETSTWQHTQHSQHTNVHAPVGFEPTVSVGERPQTYALECAATGTGFHLLLAYIISFFLHLHSRCSAFSLKAEKHAPLLPVSSLLH